MKKGCVDLKTPSGRIICISDVHGEYRLLLELLDRYPLGEDDLLILLGDMIERGDDSPQIIERIYSMRDDKRVLYLRGNWEQARLKLLNERDLDEICDFAHKRPNALMVQWARQLGYDLTDRSVCEEGINAIYDKYGDIISWLNDRPYCAQTDDYIFVHAGFSKMPDDLLEDPMSYLANGDFLTWQKNETGKWVIVGHWPVKNIIREDCTHNPVIDYERRIAGIDGGVHTTDYYQLNVLIIENGELSFDFCDYYEKTKCQKSVKVDKQNICMHGDSWPDHRLEILEKGEHFSYCRRVKSKREGHLKNEFIMDDEKGPHAYFFAGALLDVEEGEIVSVLETNFTGYDLIKKENGVIGWVPKGVI
ncbi:MAG: hypothetical protein E7334_04010 [Clostridiales bacterium]|nr:hypothetical protein [Clostridiales bacterium]